MDYRILGPLEVLDRGRPLPLGSAKEQTLLGVLLLHANHVVSRERLIDELWGEEVPATAPKAVQVYVSQLRKRLAHNGSPIATREVGYVLEVDAECLDVNRFDRLVAEARERAPGETETAARLFRTALALWRGETLAGLRFQSYAASEVARLEHARLGAVMDRIDCDLTLGSHSEVVGELETLVAQHPFEERLRSQLMLALYRTGRQADALRAYREAREMFVQELGIEPSAGVQRLERAILTHDPAIEAPREPVRPGAAPTPAREEEPAAAAHVRVQTKRHPWRRPRVVAAGVVLMAAIVGAAFLLTRATETSLPPTLQTIAPNSVAVIDPTRNAVVSQVPVGGRPTGISIGEGAVWVGNSQQQTLLRIDPQTRRVVRTIGLGVTPWRIAVGAGAVWVASYESKTVVKIDPISNAVTDKFAVSLPDTAREQALGGPEDIAVGEGTLWIAHGFDVVSRLGVGVRGAVERIRAGSGGGITFGNGAAWSVSGFGQSRGFHKLGPERHDLGALSRIDPETNSVTTIPVPSVGRVNAPNGVVFGDGAVWVIKYDGTLFQFDGATGRLAALLRLGRTAGNPSGDPTGLLDVTVGEEAVWATAGRGTVFRVDPATKSVVPIPLGRYPRLAYPLEIAAGEGAVWVTME